MMQTSGYINDIRDGNTENPGHKIYEHLMKVASGRNVPVQITSWLLALLVSGFNVYLGGVFSSGPWQIGFDYIIFFIAAVIYGLIILFWLGLIFFTDTQVFIPTTLSGVKLSGFMRDVYASPITSGVVLKNIRKWVMVVNFHHIMPWLVVFISYMFAVWVILDDPLLNGIAVLSLISLFSLWRFLVTAGIVSAILPKKFTVISQSLILIIAGLFTAALISQLVIVDRSDVWKIVLIMIPFEILNFGLNRLLLKFFTNRRNGVWS